MLVWKPGNFKILIIGGNEDLIPRVERRLGQVISLPIDFLTIAFTELQNETVILSPVNLILVNKGDQEQFEAFMTRQFFSDGGFIPSLFFQLIDGDADEGIEFYA